MKKKNNHKIIDTGIGSAETNMQLDEELLFELDPQGVPILHLYDWEGPSATYGYFIKPEELFDLEVVKRKGLSLARRPTGGGVVFHLWDYAFSLLMPSNHPLCFSTPLENYHFVNSLILKAMQPFLPSHSEAELFAVTQAGSFCMEKPTIYDVVVQGKKIAGAAQRRRKNGYLHQGTISLMAPDQSFLQELLLEKGVGESIATCSFVASIERDQIKSRLREEFQCL